jgi:hypothetical protein
MGFTAFNPSYKLWSPRHPTSKSLRLIRNLVKPYSEKYSSSVFQKNMITLPHPASVRGAYRDRHGRKEAGCGGREEAQRVARADESILADGQVVWS